MGYMTINNRRVAFTDEKNVLSVIRKSGIDPSYVLLSFRTVNLWGVQDVCGGR